MKNRHRWKWSEVGNAGEASAQVRHRFPASVIPALVCTWWWGTKEEEASHWPGSERDRRKQKTAQVDTEPSAYLTAAPTKAVAAGTPATSGPLKDPDRMQAHCLNQRILYAEKQGQEPNKTKPKWSCCIPCRNLHYKHLASKTSSVLDNRKRKLLLSVSLCYRQTLSLFNCRRDHVKQIYI